MCRLCQLKPVYEFTNKRKLCKRCFVNYFQKKVLYTIKKFNMIKTGDIIGYKKGSRFKEVVLGNILGFISEKSSIKIARLQNKKVNRIAADSSLDSEAEEIILVLIKGNVSELKKLLPVTGNIIKPLYLFLDEEIELYARIKKLKFIREKAPKDKINKFIDESEKKHPEVKRAVVNSLLGLYQH